MSCRYELFEEAYEIYRKFGLKQAAVRVLLDHMEDLDRAHEYATKARTTDKAAGADLACGGLRCLGCSRVARRLCLVAVLLRLSSCEEAATS